jgi:6-phosphofructokinase 1
MASGHIGVLTSGGDCPGLNACVRAVVRAAGMAGLRVSGIRYGYRGIVDGDIIPLDDRSVSGIIHLGGTKLRTSRFLELHEPAVVKETAARLDQLQLDGLIVVGGDGSQRAAIAVAEHARTRIVFVPKTIDNDVSGTDYAIGFDSAVNTAVEAIDKIRDTALSHERIFAVEVMGRGRGILAAAVALASGAEVVCVPEVPWDAERIATALLRGSKKGKCSGIIVVAEGCPGGAARLVQELARKLPFEIRVSVLGYMQRGGSPTAFDRILASQLGAQAVDVLVAGTGQAVMVGRVQERLVIHDLREALALEPHSFRELHDLCHRLAGIWQASE